VLPDLPAQHYSSKTDDELLALAANPDSLVEEARPILADELRRRNLPARPAQIAVEPLIFSPEGTGVAKFFRTAGAFLMDLATQPIQSAVEYLTFSLGGTAVAKFLRAAGVFLLNLAIAILGTSMIESSISSQIGHARSLSGIEARLWLSSLTIAALLGFFVCRRWPTKSAMWVWTLPVVFFAFRVLLYRSSNSALVGSSILKHFLAPNCLNDTADCHDFLIFTISAARTVAYSLAAWVSWHFHGRPSNQTGETNGWTITEATIVGAVWYTSSLLVLLPSVFAVYSIPSLHSLLHFYQLDTILLEFGGALGGILFAGPTVMWIVRRRKVVSLQESIRWDCSNSTFGWALLTGLASGITYSLTRSALLGRGYQEEGAWYIAAFLVLAGLVQPALEEIYFRGILFVALAGRLGKFSSMVVVTLLFSLAHPRHFLTVLPVAILLGGVRLFTGSVKACYATHAAYNMSLMLLMFPINL
jgi:membrane protease YdiL (CAAX protease family)